MQRGAVSECKLIICQDRLGTDIRETSPNTRHVPRFLGVGPVGKLVPRYTTAGGHVMRAAVARF
jgi:hypothetical protein